jgi:hypothetical protein
MAKNRTTLRSKAGKKLYAVRDEAGQFTDIQTYKRAQGADIRRHSAAELAKKATKAKKKVTKSKAKKTKTTRAKTTKKKMTRRSKK